MLGVKARAVSNGPGAPDFYTRIVFYFCLSSVSSESSAVKAL